MPETQTTRAVIVGATGRMGRALVCAAAEFPQLKITGAVASPGSAGLGRDPGEAAGTRLGIEVSADLSASLSGADVVIDFSLPHAVADTLAACRAAGKALLIGTTGFAPRPSEADLHSASREIALLVAPNTSLGVTLLTELVRTAARALPPQFDIEILERHHRLKRDAPSGTALTLAGAAAEGRQLPAEQATAGVGCARAGLRRQGEIGFAVARGGDAVGEHEVWFAGPGERLALSHQATDRAIFARGALRAALWLAGRPAGRYMMRDILFKNQ